MTEIHSKIESFLIEAVAKYDCVILPEFGAFVSRYVSAEINRSSNIILPPSKNISFNVHLKHNDGLLAGYIANKLSVNYEAALELIKTYSKNISDTLNTKKRLELNGLGVLFVNNAQQLQFEPNINWFQGQYNFGFTPIILQAIQTKPYLKNQTAHSQIAREDKVVLDEQDAINLNKPINLKKIKRNYLSLGILIPVVAALCYVSIKTVEKPNWDLAGIFSNFSSEAKHVNENKKEISTTPLYNPANTQIDLMAYAELSTEDASLNNKYINLLTPEKTFLITSSANEKSNNIASAEITIPINNNPNNGEKVIIENLKPKPEVEISNAIEIKKSDMSLAKKNSDSYKALKNNTTSISKIGAYSIIVGCFSENGNAEKLVKKLKSTSIDALVDGKNDKGLTVVSAGKFATKEEATQYLNALKEQNIKAWIKH
jgi:cell division septation protein DedD